jgi:hypothetical protein
MSGKRKLFCLNVEQKKEICAYHLQNPEKTQKQIADVFSAKFDNVVSRRTVGDILANKQKWIDFVVQGNPAKKLKCAKHSSLEEALQIWFANARSQNVVITDAILREKAKKFGSLLSINETDFQYSNGWLQRFKNRCGISSQTICGESAGVDPVIISDGRLQARQWIAQYQLCDVYNLDETGLFFRMLPDRSLTTTDKSKGAKKPKERISIMLCANADGTHKVKPLIIGKSLNPRCFKNFQPKLYCDYYANNKAWMINGILQEFLVSFNRRMKRENRHILMLMDNAPSHIIPKNLTNVRVEFLPPTTTSHLQPMDAGIINAYKAHYRRYLVQYYVDEIDAGRLPKIEISNAIRWTKLAWDEISANTISACWRHTGILPIEASDNLVPDLPSSPAKLFTDFGNIFERLMIPSVLLMTPAEFIDVDGQLQTCDLMNDDQIINLVSDSSAATDSFTTRVDEQSASEDDDDGSQGDIPQPRTVNNSEARQAIDTLLRYFEGSDLATDSDIEPLSQLKRRVEHMRVISQKQSTIVDFFTAK